MDYYELQRFRKPVLFALLLLTSAILLAVLVYLFSINYTGSLIAFYILFAAFGINLFITVLLIILRFELVINEAGIYYRLIPFHHKPKHIPWSQVVTAEITRFNALSDFGGWGYRFIPGKKIRAFIFDGHSVLRLTLQKKQGYAFTTRNPDTMWETIENYYVPPRVSV